jgi:DNA polymerase
MRSLIKRDLEAKPLTAAEWPRLTGYARRDGEVLRAADRKLPPMPDAWRPIFELDSLMNDAGMPVDLEAVGKLIVVRNAENRRLAYEFKRLTNGELSSPKQVAKFRARLRVLGVDLPNVRRETLETWADENAQRNDFAADLIHNRLQSSHSSDTKLDRILATAASTGRVRGGFTLHGAHTGRWSGQGVQCRTCPRGSRTTRRACYGRCSSGRTGSPPARSTRSRTPVGLYL